MYIQTRNNKRYALITFLGANNSIIVLKSVYKVIWGWQYKMHNNNNKKKKKKKKKNERKHHSFYEARRVTKTQNLWAKF